MDVCEARSIIEWLNVCYVVDSDGYDEALDEITFWFENDMNAANRVRSALEVLMLADNGQSYFEILCRPGPDGIPGNRPHTWYKWLFPREWKLWQSKKLFLEMSELVEA